MAVGKERLHRIQENTTPEDIAAIRSDWQAVGDDLRAVMPDDPDDIVFLGEPIARRRIQLRITGRRKGQPLLYAPEFDL